MPSLLPALIRLLPLILRPLSVVAATAPTEALRRPLSVSHGTRNAIISHTAWALAARSVWGLISLFVIRVLSLKSIGFTAAVQKTSDALR